jgi:hypothetical protein
VPVLPAAAVTAGTAYGLDSPRDAAGWWERGACTRVDPDLHASVRWVDRAEALHICLTHCPVLAQCRADALARPYRSMVVGGLAFGTDAKPSTYPGPARSCRLCTGTGPMPALLDRHAEEIASMRDAGASLAQIGQALGYTVEAIRKWLIRHGLPTSRAAT